MNLLLSTLLFYPKLVKAPQLSFRTKLEICFFLFTKADCSSLRYSE